MYDSTHHISTTGHLKLSKQRFTVILNAYSGNDREQDLRAYEGKQLRMYQETPFVAYSIYVKLQDIFFCVPSLISLLFIEETSIIIGCQTYSWSEMCRICTFGLKGIEAGTNAGTRDQFLLTLKLYEK